jgi:hypothetical protein
MRIIGILLVGFVTIGVQLGCSSPPPTTAVIPIQEPLTADLAKDAHAKAQILLEALLTGQHDKVVDMTHPSIVENTSRHFLKVNGKQVLKNIEDAGYDPNNATITVGEINDSVRVGDETFVAIPYTTVLENAEQRRVIQLFLVGVYDHRSQSWTFIDGEQVNNGSIRKLLPIFPSILKIPKLPEPYTEKN